MKRILFIFALIISATSTIFTYTSFADTTYHKHSAQCQHATISIFVDGKEIREFSFLQKNYKRFLPMGTTKVPVVKAFHKKCSGTSQLQVVQATSPDGVAVVKFPEGNDYTVSFAVAQKPFLKLKSPDITDVKITDKFWRKQLNIFSKTTIQYSFDKFEEQGSIRQFQNIINKTPKAENNPWLDGLLFETIRAAGDFLLIENDPALVKRINSYIDVVFEASMTTKDGYLSTHVLAKCPDKRFDANKNAIFFHDSYNFGCMVEAGLHYYKATKNPKLLYVACRFAEHIVANYGYGQKADGAHKINMVPSHSLPEEALLHLYEFLNENPDVVKTLNKFEKRYPLDIKPEKYADLVKFWIENRGNYNHRENDAKYGFYAQDHKYYFDQKKGEGHAVRANLYYTGIASAGVTFNNQTYISVADKIWNNIYYKQMYVTGSVGAVGPIEAYGDDFVLPNDGYCETCAAAAYGFFTHYLTEAHGEATYADAMETEIYNGVLGCIGENGKTFYYKNPLNAKNHPRWGWHGCACCPPMFLKFYAQLQKYIYSFNAKEVYVNQFIANTAKLANGVEITMNSAMPWNAKVNIEIAKKDTVLKIRIPHWTTGEKPKMLINQKLFDYKVERGYAVANVKAGDKIVFDIPLKTRKVRGRTINPTFKLNPNRVSFAYGPLVYAVETIDNKQFGNATKEFAGYVPYNATLSGKFESNLLGGIYTITTTAIDNFGNKQTLKAIPYYARGNRGKSGQYVWICEE